MDRALDYAAKGDQVMRLAVRRNVSVPATALSYFCRQVARTYRINAALGYPANRIDLRQYMNVDSDTYFPWIADTVDEAIRDDALRLCNQENLGSWRQLVSTRAVGAEPTRIRDMITVLEAERLLIEHSCAESAFCFCDGSSVQCTFIQSPASLRRQRDEFDSDPTESRVLTLTRS